MGCTSPGSRSRSRGSSTSRAEHAPSGSEPRLVGGAGRRAARGEAQHAAPVARRERVERGRARRALAWRRAGPAELHLRVRRDRRRWRHLRRRRALPRRSRLRGRDRAHADRSRGRRSAPAETGAASRRSWAWRPSRGRAGIVPDSSDRPASVTEELVERATAGDPRTLAALTRPPRRSGSRLRRPSTFSTSTASYSRDVSAHSHRGSSKRSTRPLRTRRAVGRLVVVRRSGVDPRRAGRRPWGRRHRPPLGPRPTRGRREARAGSGHDDEGERWQRHERSEARWKEALATAHHKPLEVSEVVMSRCGL